MEQTLKEKLRDLQSFLIPAIYFCRIKGNGIAGRRWRITYIHTAGGEQFCFNQVSDYPMGEGGGIYWQTVDEAAVYAEEITRHFLAKNILPVLQDAIGDPFDYDWFVQSYEEMSNV